MTGTVYSESRLTRLHRLVMGINLCFWVSLHLSSKKWSRRNAGHANRQPHKSGWTIGPMLLRMQVMMIVLSASCDLHDKVALLEMGADDYITKLFSPRELLARLRVALGHTKLHATASQIVFDGIVVDFGKVEVTRNRASVELTAHEFKTPQF